MNEAHTTPPDPYWNGSFLFSSRFLSPVGSDPPSCILLSIFFFTRVSRLPLPWNKIQEDRFQKQNFLLLSSFLSLSLFFSLASSLFVSFSLPLFLHPPNQYYLIIDRMILLSARMARPAEQHVSLR